METLLVSTIKSGKFRYATTVKRFKKMTKHCKQNTRVYFKLDEKSVYIITLKQLLNDYIKFYDDYDEIYYDFEID